MRQFDLARGLVGWLWFYRDFVCASTDRPRPVEGYALALYREGRFENLKSFETEARALGYIRDLYPRHEEVTHG